MVVAGFDRYDLTNTPFTDCPTFTIWFAGCTHGCPGCHNIQLWDPKHFQQFTVEEVAGLIVEETEKTNIRIVTLLGGEPLQQPLDELYRLCTMLHDAGKEIWIYTGYDFDDAIQIIYPVLPLISMMKCGKYIRELSAGEGAFPATTNQKLFKNIGGDMWQEVIINQGGR